MTSSRGSPPGLLSAFLVLALPLGAAETAARSGRASEARAARLAQVAPAADLLVPAVVDREAADGSREVTELTLTNRGVEDTLLTISYAAGAGPGSGTAQTSLRAGRQVTIPDTLAYLRDLGLPVPESGEQRGSLRIRVEGADGTTSVSASARTSFGPAGRRAGYSYPAVATAHLAERDTVYVTSLRETAGDHSTLALLNAGQPEDGDVTLRVTIRSGDPSQPQAETLPDLLLAPGREIRLEDLLTAHGEALPNAYVSVQRVLGAAPFYAYALLTDRSSGDSAFLPPSSVEPGSQRLTLPAVVQTARYSTEIALTNTAPQPRTLRLRFVADGLRAPGNAVETTLELAAGEQRFVPDLSGFLRDRGVLAEDDSGEHSGALFASVDGGGVVIGARTSRTDEGGRYSVAYAAVPDEAAASDTAWIYGLRQDGSSRSNLAIVNVDASATDVFRVEIFDGDSGMRTATLEGEAVGPGGWWQISSVLQRAPATSNGYVRVTRTAGGGAFLVYAVLNDGARPGEGSGDGTFLAMDPARAPLLVVEEDRVDFGKVRVGHGSAFTVTVRNAGGAALHATAILTAAEPFSVTPGSFELAPGETRGLAVRFQPVVAGLSRGTLEINGDGALASVPLEGLGIDAVEPVIDVSVTELDFGRVAVGASRKLSLTVRNAGTAALVVQGLSVSGADFAADDERFAVPPGGSRDVTVRFTPSLIGPRAATLTIACSDPARPDVTVALSGHGAQPSLSELYSDDGSVEAGVFGNGVIVVNRFTPALYPTTLRKLKLFVARFPGFADPSGLVLDLVTFVDPSGGGTPPADHDNLSHQPVKLPRIPPEGLLVEIDVDNGPTIESGDLYAGFQSPAPYKGLVFACDLDGPQAGRSFLSDSGGRDYRPLTVNGAQGGGLPGNLILRAVVSNP